MAIFHIGDINTVYSVYLANFARYFAAAFDVQFTFCILVLNGKLSYQSIVQYYHSIPGNVYPKDGAEFNECVIFGFAKNLFIKLPLLILYTNLSRKV